MNPSTFNQSTSQPVTRKKGPRAHSGSIHDSTWFYIWFYIILYDHILEKSQIAKLPALSRTSNTTRTWWSPQSQRQSVVFLTVQWSSNGHPMVLRVQLDLVTHWALHILLRSSSPSWTFFSDFCTFSMRIWREKNVSTRLPTYSPIMPIISYIIKIVYV